MCEQSERSSTDGNDVSEHVQKRGCCRRSLQEPWETTFTPKAKFHSLGPLTLASQGYIQLHRIPIASMSRRNATRSDLCRRKNYGDLASTLKLSDRRSIIIIWAEKSDRWKFWRPNQFRINPLPLNETKTTVTVLAFSNRCAKSRRILIYYSNFSSPRDLYAAVIFSHESGARPLPARSKSPRFESSFVVAQRWTRYSIMPRSHVRACVRSPSLTEEENRAGKARIVQIRCRVRDNLNTSYVWRLKF